MINFIQNGILSAIRMPSEASLKVVMVVMALLCVALPYMLGSFNTAVFVSKRFYRSDIRESGSGNAGLTNMHRVYGGKAALLVLLGDVLKMVLSLLWAWLLFGAHFGPYAFCQSSFAYLAGLACIVGHIFPVSCGFRGGKGVLCTAVMVLMLSPLVFVGVLLIFALLLLTTRYVSLSSISAGLFYPLLLNRIAAFCGYTMDGTISLISVGIGLLILYCHRANISRLLDKTESKFSFHKK